LVISLVSANLQLKIYNLQVYYHFGTYIIASMNELLKNKANIVHPQYRSTHNFIMNLCLSLTA